MEGLKDKIEQLLMMMLNPNLRDGKDYSEIRDEYDKALQEYHEVKGLVWRGGK
jgi:hypothetical protein